MQRLWFGPWLKNKLAHVIEDFDTKAGSFDIRKGALCLNDVRLAPEALQTITEHLCCAVPFVARTVMIGKASVQLNWGSGPFSEPVQIVLEGVEIYLETLRSSDWDLAKASENLHKAKMRALQVHSKIVRLGYTEGAGFLHSLVATVLDNLEFTGSGLQCFLEDSASLQMDVVEHPFTVGMGVAEFEMKRRERSTFITQGAVLRHLSMAQPYVFLDAGVGSAGAAAAFRARSRSGVESSSSAVESPDGGDTSSPLSFPSSKSTIFSGTSSKTLGSHEWILKPSPTLAFEIGVLQCNHVAYVDPRPTGNAAGQQEPANERSFMIKERDIAELAVMFHKGDDKEDDNEASATKESSRLPLPRSAVVICMGPQTAAATADQLPQPRGAVFDLSPKHVECLLALVAFAGLGYGAVLSGVNAEHELPTRAEQTSYGEMWLKALLLDDAIALSDADIEEFEMKHPLAVIEQAREAMITNVSSEVGEISVKDSEFVRPHQQSCTPFFASHMTRAKLMGKRWCTHHIQGSSVSIEHANWQETSQLIHETLTLRNPLWQQSWRDLCQAKVPAMLVGAKLQRLCVNIVLEDEEALVATPSSYSLASSYSTNSLGQPKWHKPPNYLSLSMDQILLSLTEQDKDMPLAQASLVQFRVEDHYGPWKLRQLAKHAQRALHTPRHRVLVHAGGHAASGSTVANLGDKKSELYIAVGRRKQRSGNEKPDVTLQLRSFGELHVYIPPIQLAVLCVTLFPPKVRHHLSRCLGGSPWRSGAPETVLEMAERGMKAKKEIWRNFSEGQIDSWFLVVNLQPVHILMPVPGQQVSSSSFSHQASNSEPLPHSVHDETNQVIDICLGKMTASSKLLPRRNTDALPALSRSARARSYARIVEEYYDEYATDLANFSIQRRAVNEPKGREILPSTDMKLILKICHWTWTWIGLPESLMEVDAPKFLLELTSPDIETCIELLAEMRWVMTDLTEQMTEKAQKAAKANLMRLANTHGRGKTGHGRGLPKAQDILNASYLEGRKLMNLKFDSRNAVLRMSLPKAQEDVLPEQLEISLAGISCSGFLCIDGSTRCSASVDALEVAGTGARGAKLYSSDRQWQRGKRGSRKGTAEDPMLSPRPASSPRRHLEHIRLTWTLTVPLAIGQQWRFDVSLAVQEPTMMIWWPTLAGLSRLFARCSKQVSFLKSTLNEQVLLDEVKTKTVRWAKHVQDLGDILWMLPEWFSFSMHVQRAQVLVPLKLADETGPAPPLLRIFISPYSYLERSKEKAETWKSHTSACKFSAELLLPDRAGLRFGERSADPDPWNWILSGARVSALPLLSQCRIHSDCRIKRSSSLKVQLGSEPLKISVFPATRQLLTDVGLVIATFAARLLEERSHSKEKRVSRLAHQSPEFRKQDEAPISSQVSSSLSPEQGHLKQAVTFCDKDSYGEDIDAADSDTESERPISLPSRFPSHGRFYTRSFDDSQSLTVDSTLGDVEWLVRSVSHFALDIAGVTSQNCEVELSVKNDNVMLHFSDAPGGAQPLHAIVSVEDFALHAKRSTSNQEPNINALAESTGQVSQSHHWKMAFETMMRIEALDALSLQVELIMEPVYVSWRLKKIWKGDGYQNLLPVGEFSMSWMNLVLPLGVFYAVKLWIMAESLLKRGKEEESSPLRRSSRDSVPRKDYRRMFTDGPAGRRMDRLQTTPIRTPRSTSTGGLGEDRSPDTGSEEADSPGVLTHFRRELIGCDVVNQLGLPLAVKRTDKEPQRWCLVQPSKLQNGAMPAEMNESAVRTAAVSVPPMVIRGAFRGHIFEVELLSPLQVPQFEVIQLKLPPTVSQVRSSEKHDSSVARSQLLSLILRAVPDHLGHGCSLLVSTTLMVRNNTGFGLTWTCPSTSPSQDNACNKQLTSNDLSEVAEVSSTLLSASPVRHVVSAVTAVGEAAHSARQAVGNISETVAPTMTHAVSAAGAHASAAGAYVSAAGERITGAAIGAFRTQHRNTSWRWLAPSIDGSQNHEGIPETDETKEDRTTTRNSGEETPLHCRPYQRKPLPLAWLASATDPVQNGELLQLRLDDSDVSDQVLPSETLTRLCAFDFSMPHRDAEQSAHLDGELLKLQDSFGKQVHLCCTLTVGLLADRACYLEIVVSSIFMLQNHLPFHITATPWYQERAMAARELEAGGTVKEYLAADTVLLELDTEEWGLFKGPLRLNTKEPFTSTEEFQVLAQLHEADSHSTRRHTSPMSNSWSIRSTVRSNARAADQQIALSLNVLCSSAFDHDVTTQLQHSSTDAWLETLSWFHPPEWKTYRRAVTIYAKCLVQNCSSIGVWFRAAGARGVTASSLELHVPMDESRILPAHLAATGKMSISTVAKARRRQMDFLRWETRGRRRRGKTVKTLHIKVGDSKVLLGAVVDRGPIPFNKTLVIKLYDYVTLENRIDSTIQCWVPMSYRIPSNLRVHNCCNLYHKCCSKATDLVEPEMLLVIPAQTKKRVDTEALRFRIVANQEEDAARFSPRNTPKSPRNTQSNLEQGDQSITRSTGAASGGANLLTGIVTQIIGGGKTDGREISMDRPASFQVRFVTGVINGWPKYQNLRISVQKLHQGAATHVTFEPGEPRYVILNEVPFPVTIGQQGCPGMLELLLPKDKLEFVWYDPDGTLKLEVKRHDTNPGDTPGSAGAGSAFESLAKVVGRSTRLNLDEEQPECVSEFDASIGLEIMRIVLKESPRREQAAESLHARFISGVLSMATNATDTGTLDIPGDVEGLHSRPGLRLFIEGLGISLLDHTPLQIVYAAIDEVTVHVAPSHAQRQTSSHLESTAETLLNSISTVDSMSSIQVSSDPSSKLVGAPPYATTEVTSSAGTLHEASRAISEVNQGASASSVGSTEFDSLAVMLLGLLRYVPSVDMRVSILNLQVDSHIPGGFFDCSLRPLHGRSHLFRAFHCISDSTGSLRTEGSKKGNLPMKKPMLNVEINGCNLMARPTGGGAVMMKDCKADLDKVTVNIDEALLVGLSAYYCRVAVYFNLPPFQDPDKMNRMSSNEGMKFQMGGKSLQPSASKSADTLPSVDHQKAKLTAMPILDQKAHSWLLTVEEAIQIQDNTTYWSVRLMESANPYLEGLQRDEHVGHILGMLMPLYAAALFQPAMLSHRSRQLYQKRVCMSLKEMFKLLNEHFVAPLQQRIGLFLWISFDWLGNPQKLFFGILVGFRELFMQPYRRGPCRGIPRGIEVCLCSVFGSVFDSLARVINAVFKSIDRALRYVHKAVGLENISRKGTSILSLSRTPVNFRNGLRQGTLLALLQCRTVFRNMREIVRVFLLRGRQEYRFAIVYLIVFVITVVLTVGVGLIEAILLLLYNLLQGLVISLYRRSAEDVCDWDPMQLVALEMPMPIRPCPQRDEVAVGGARSLSSRGSAVAPFAYLPAMVRQAVDPDQELVPPWQWRRWTGADDDVRETVLAALWCGGLGGRKPHSDNETFVLFQTNSHIGLLRIKDYGRITSKGRPRKPKAKYRTIWNLSRSNVRSLQLCAREGGWMLKVEMKRSKPREQPFRKAMFASKNQAFRALEMLSPEITDDSPEYDSIVSSS